MYQNCCKKCGSVSLYTEQKGNNIGLYCSDCGAWIKWLGKDEVRAFEHSQKSAKSKVNQKEFHLWFNIFYPKYKTDHIYQIVERRIKDNETTIHTTQIQCVSTRLFELGYRIFVHCQDESIFEITLGRCERTSREIRMEHNLAKLLISGEFDI